MSKAHRHDNTSQPWRPLFLHYLCLHYRLFSPVQFILQLTEGKAALENAAFDKINAFRDKSGDFWNNSINFNGFLTLHRVCRQLVTGYTDSLAATVYALAAESFYSAPPTSGELHFLKLAMMQSASPRRLACYRTGRAARFRGCPSSSSFVTSIR